MKRVKILPFVDKTKKKQHVDIFNKKQKIYNTRFENFLCCNYYDLYDN